MMDRKRPIQVGDTVRHSSTFLRNVGWYTEVPVNGIVRELTPFSDRVLATVEWSQEAPPKILTSNLQLIKGAV